MDITNNTEHGLTQGDLHVIVSLGILKANEAGWLALGSHLVVLEWDKAEAEYVVEFRRGLSERITVRVPRKDVELQYQKGKEAKRDEYLESIRGICEEAVAALYTAQQELEALGVPASLSGLIETLGEEFRAQGDNLDALCDRELEYHDELIVKSVE